MKKVLIIGYLHPFTQRQMGSFRLLPLANYLPIFGWQPIVLTAPLKESPNLQLKILEAPCQDILSFWKRLLGFVPDEDTSQQIKKRLGVISKTLITDFVLNRVGEIINYPDSEKKWRTPALETARTFLQHEDVDVMMSCHPKISHIIANELEGKFGIPWVADFPDLWSQNHNYQYSPLRGALDRRLELKTLSKADALTTVAEPWAEKLRTLHQRKPVYTITHGFSAEEVNDPPAPLTAKFTITYTGSIYTGKQNPSKLFAALRDLISSGIVNPDEIEVRFFGPELGWLDMKIEEYGLTSFVKQYEPIQQHTAIEKQKESQLLLLLDWDDPQEKGLYTGKIFEYFGSRRPVLATGGSKGDVVGDLLNETKTGIHAPTVEDIKSALIELYQEYKLKGKLAYRGKESEVNKYSHREVARKFSEILNKLA